MMILFVCPRNRKQALSVRTKDSLRVAANILFWYSMNLAAITVAAAADFKGLIVSDIWHGIVYRMTYTIRQPHYASYLSSVSHNLTRVGCPTILVCFRKRKNLQ
eukprot:TRINITY_DN4961_c1_g1_i2.p1 TRINITY_DN4961_c1_g1~~TRINITY_DN4961_c1_g1_i2.p1  ORF type:complete len:104 (-),score=2.88 TRINITY_DN4961_c1_g1_i2:411-722(-)